MDSLIPEGMKVGGKTEQQERYERLTAKPREWSDKEWFGLIEPAPVGDTLNVKFSLRDRLKFAWRAFRWPHALRNALHFAQEAKTCLEEIDLLERDRLCNATVKSSLDLTGDAIEELERVEELLKFTQDY